MKDLWNIWLKEADDDGLVSDDDLISSWLLDGDALVLQGDGYVESCYKKASLISKEEQSVFDTRTEFESPINDG